MSKKKKPSIPSGWTQEEINASAEEAIENGTMEAIDILGNTEPFDVNEHDVIYGMLNGDEKDLPIGLVLSMIKHLQGKVLTIVDASYDDKERVKFVKDLMKDAFRNSANTIHGASKEGR